MLRKDQKSIRNCDVTSAQGPARRYFCGPRRQTRFPGLHALQPLLVSPRPIRSNSGRGQKLIIRDAIWCCCRQSTVRRRLPVRLTSPRIHGTRSKPGTLPARLTTCPASTLHFVGNSITARQMCRTSRDLEKLHRRPVRLLLLSKISADRREHSCPVSRQI